MTRRPREGGWVPWPSVAGGFGAGLLALLLFPAVSFAAPAPPRSIARYIVDGRLRPGDYAWLRGAFRGADAGEVAAYEEVVDWRRRCRAADLEETREELGRLGVVAGHALDSMPYRTLACGQASTLPEPLNLGDWAGFARDVSVVRPIAEGFLAALDAGDRFGLGNVDDVRFALAARVIADQTLRGGLTRPIARRAPDGSSVALTPRQNGILASELDIALQERDQANTAWLKGIVARRGWPKQSEVGERAARLAWLLAQHADADPAFQVQALRLMEPLASSGEASRGDYAFLYDRVMLRVTGRQRYATQLTCVRGRLVPMPLRDEGGVDVERRRMGLASLADYEARTLRELGGCDDDAAR